MTITISRSTTDDINELVRLGEKAFVNDQLMQGQYALTTCTPEQLADYRRWRAAYSTASSVGAGKYSWKAVDDTTGEIVGLALFHDPHAVTIDPGSIPMPAHANMEAVNDWRTKQKATKERCVGGRSDVWTVKSMGVHPDYQGRGIARKLMQYGLDAVDEAGGAAYLEATVAGHKLYLDCGFKDLEDIVLFNGEYVMSAMFRPPQTRPS